MDFCIKAPNKVGDSLFLVDVRLNTKNSPGSSTAKAGERTDENAPYKREEKLPTENYGQSERG